MATGNSGVVDKFLVEASEAFKEQGLTNADFDELIDSTIHSEWKNDKSINPDAIFKINDIDLEIPPIQITINKEDMFWQHKTLRTKVSTKVPSGHGVCHVALTIVFTPDLLLHLHRLITMFRHSPFCRVENKLLRQSIVPHWPIVQSMAFTMTSLNVAPMRGQPGTFICELDLRWFNYFPYTPNYLFKREWRTVPIEMDIAAIPKTDVSTEYKQVSKARLKSGEDYVPGRIYGPDEFIPGEVVRIEPVDRSVPGGRVLRYHTIPMFGEDFAPLGTHLYDSDPGGENMSKRKRPNYSSLRKKTLEDRPGDTLGISLAHIEMLHLGTAFDLLPRPNLMEPSDPVPPELSNIYVRYINSLQQKALFFDFDIDICKEVNTLGDKNWNDFTRGVGVDETFFLDKYREGLEGAKDHITGTVRGLHTGTLGQITRKAVIKKMLHYCDSITFYYDSYMTLDYTPHLLNLYKNAQAKKDEPFHLAVDQSLEATLVASSTEDTSEIKDEGVELARVPDREGEAHSSFYDTSNWEGLDGMSWPRFLHFSYGGLIEREGEGEAQIHYKTFLRYVRFTDDTVSSYLPQESMSAREGHGFITTYEIPQKDESNWSDGLLLHPPVKEGVVPKHGAFGTYYPGTSELDYNNPEASASPVELAQTRVNHGLSLKNKYLPTEGSPVYAVEDGKIVGVTRTPMDMKIEIVHKLAIGGEFWFEYSNLAFFRVDFPNALKVGDTVARGQVIGYLGPAKSTLRGQRGRALLDEEDLPPGDDIERFQTHGVDIGPALLLKVYKLDLENRTKTGSALNPLVFLTAKTESEALPEEESGELAGEKQAGKKRVNPNEVKKGSRRLKDYAIDKEITGHEGTQLNAFLNNAGEVDEAGSFFTAINPIMSTGKTRFYLGDADNPNDFLILEGAPEAENKKKIKRELLETIHDKVHNVALYYGIPEDLIYMQMYHESRLSPMAKGGAPDHGLGQFITSTAKNTWKKIKGKTIGGVAFPDKDLDFSDEARFSSDKLNEADNEIYTRALGPELFPDSDPSVYNIDVNITLTGALLSALKDSAAGNLDLMLWSYNRGGGRVVDYLSGRNKHTPEATKMWPDILGMKHVPKAGGSNYPKTTRSDWKKYAPGSYDALQLNKNGDQSRVANSEVYSRTESTPNKKKIKWEAPKAEDKDRVAQAYVEGEDLFEHIPEDKKAAFALLLQLKATGWEYYEDDKTITNVWKRSNTYRMQAFDHNAGPSRGNALSGTPHLFAREDAVITGVAAGLRNIVATIPILSSEFPTHQSLGSIEPQYMIELATQDNINSPHPSGLGTSAEVLEGMRAELQQNARSFRPVPDGHTLCIDHFITRLFGTFKESDIGLHSMGDPKEPVTRLLKRGVITSLTTKTIEGQPGRTDLFMELSETNPFEAEIITPPQDGGIDKYAIRSRVLHALKNYKQIFKEQEIGSRKAKAFGAVVKKFGKEIDMSTVEDRIGIPRDEWKGMLEEYEGRNPNLNNRKNRTYAAFPADKIDHNFALEVYVPEEDRIPMFQMPSSPKNWYSKNTAWRGGKTFEPGKQYPLSQVPARHRKEIRKNFGISPAEQTIRTLDLEDRNIVSQTSEGNYMAGLDIPVVRLSDKQGIKKAYLRDINSAATAGPAAGAASGGQAHKAWGTKVPNHPLFGPVLTSDQDLAQAEIKAKAAFNRVGMRLDDVEALLKHASLGTAAGGTVFRGDKVVWHFDVPQPGGGGGAMFNIPHTISYPGPERDLLIVETTEFLATYPEYNVNPGTGRLDPGEIENYYLLLQNIARLTRMMLVEEAIESKSKGGVTYAPLKQEAITETLYGFTRKDGFYGAMYQNYLFWLFIVIQDLESNWLMTLPGINEDVFSPNDRSGSTPRGHASSRASGGPRSFQNPLQARNAGKREQGKEDVWSEMAQDHAIWGTKNMLWVYDLAAEDQEYISKMYSMYGGGVRYGPRFGILNDITKLIGIDWGVGVGTSGSNTMWETASRQLIDKLVHPISAGLVKGGLSSGLAFYMTVRVFTELSTSAATPAWEQLKDVMSWSPDTKDFNQHLLDEAATRGERVGILPDWLNMESRAKNTIQSYQNVEKRITDVYVQTAFGAHHGIPEVVLSNNLGFISNLLKKYPAGGGEAGMTDFSGPKASLTFGLVPQMDIVGWYILGPGAYNDTSWYAKYFGSDFGSALLKESAKASVTTSSMGGFEKGEKLYTYEHGRTDASLTDKGQIAFGDPGFEDKKLAYIYDLLTVLADRLLADPNFARMFNLNLSLDYSTGGEPVSAIGAYPDLELPLHPYWPSNSFGTNPDFYMWSIYEDGGAGFKKQTRDLVLEQAKTYIHGAHDHLKSMQKKGLGFDKTKEIVNAVSNDDNMMQISRLVHHPEGSDDIDYIDYNAEHSIDSTTGHRYLSEWVSLGPALDAFPTWPPDGKVTAPMKKKYLKAGTEALKGIQEQIDKMPDEWGWKNSRGDAQKVYDKLKELVEDQRNRKAVPILNSSDFDPQYQSVTRGDLAKYELAKTKIAEMESMFGSKAGYLGEYIVRGAHDVGEWYKVSNDIALASGDQFLHAFDKDSLTKLAEESSADILSEKLTMRRAYPTFKLYFVEEDEQENRYINFDDFYSFNGVKEFTVNRSRVHPADTAVITLQNVAGTLDGTKRNVVVDMDYFNRKELKKKKVAEDVNLDNNLNRQVSPSKDQPFEAIVLRPGLNVQLRCGYSDDPDMLEVLISGRITDISWNQQGDLTEIVVQSFGAELVQQIKKLGDTVFPTTHQLLGQLMMSPELKHFGRWEFGDIRMMGEDSSYILDFVDYNEEKGWDFDITKGFYTWIFNNPTVAVGLGIGAFVLSYFPTLGGGARKLGSKIFGKEGLKFLPGLLKTAGAGGRARPLIDPLRGFVGSGFRKSGLFGKVGGTPGFLKVSAAMAGKADDILAKAAAQEARVVAAIRSNGGRGLGGTKGEWVEAIRRRAISNIEKEWQALKGVEKILGDGKNLVGGWFGAKGGGTFTAGGARILSGFTALGRGGAAKGVSGRRKLFEAIQDFTKGIGPGIPRSNYGLFRREISTLLQDAASAGARWQWAGWGWPRATGRFGAIGMIGGTAWRAGGELLWHAPLRGLRVAAVLLPGLIVSDVLYEKVAKPLYENIIASTRRDISRVKAHLFLDPRDDNLFPPNPLSYMKTHITDDNDIPLPMWAFTGLWNVIGGGKSTTDEYYEQWKKITEPAKTLFDKRVSVSACEYHVMPGSYIWNLFHEMSLRHPGWIYACRPYGKRFEYRMFFGIPSQRWWSQPTSRGFTDRMINLRNMLDKGGTIDDRQYDRLYGPGSAKRLKESIETELSSATGQKGEAFRHPKKNRAVPTDDAGRQVGSTPDRDMVRLKGPAIVKRQTAMIENTAKLRRSTRVLQEYLKGIETKFTPFRRYHMLTSESDIVHNGLISSEHNVQNAVDVTYYPMGKSANEYANGLQPKGSVQVKASASIPENMIRMDSINFPMCKGYKMALRYGMGSLLFGMRNMYRGEILVLGNPRIQPWDICYLHDTYNDMVGPVEVEAVTHMFSHETGYLTEIKPNAVVIGNEISTWPILEGLKLFQMAVRDHRDGQNRASVNTGGGHRSAYELTKDAEFLKGDGLVDEMLQPTIGPGGSSHIYRDYLATRYTDIFENGGFDLSQVFPEEGGSMRGLRSGSPADLNTAAFWLAGTAAVAGALAFGRIRKWTLGASKLPKALTDQSAKGLVSINDGLVTSSHWIQSFKNILVGGSAGVAKGATKAGMTGLTGGLIGEHLTSGFFDTKDFHQGKGLAWLIAAPILFAKVLEEETIIVVPLTKNGRPIVSGMQMRDPNLVWQNVLGDIRNAAVDMVHGTNDVISLYRSYGDSIWSQLGNLREGKGVNSWIGKSILRNVSKP